MKKFTVSPSLRKKANQLLVNSNKLSNVFYNTGNIFLVNPSDYSECKKILDRNLIKVSLAK
jgi:FtsZ-interacting cell division protein YlmF